MPLLAMGSGVVSPATVRALNSSTQHASSEACASCRYQLASLQVCAGCLHTDTFAPMFALRNNGRVGPIDRFVRELSRAPNTAR